MRPDVVCSFRDGADVGARDGQDCHAVRRAPGAGSTHSHHPEIAKILQLTLQDVKQLVPGLRKSLVTPSAQVLLLRFSEVCRERE